MDRKVESFDTSRVQQRGLERAVSSASPDAVAAAVGALSDGSAPRAISRMRRRERTKLFTLLDSGRAAGLLKGMSALQSGDILGRLSAAKAAGILDELPSDRQADLLARLEAEHAGRVLDAMSPRAAADARQLLSYERSSTGGLMRKEFLAYPESTTPVTSPTVISAPNT